MFDCCNLKTKTFKVYDPQSYEPGNNQIPGPKGDNAYLFIAWADNDSGDGFTLSYSQDKDYIAFYQTTVEEYTPVREDFDGKWKKIKGDDGDETYLYIAYADSDQGTGKTNTPHGKAYIAVRSSSTLYPSFGDIPSNFFDNYWRKFVGDPTYIYIRYASSVNGDNFSATPIASSTYVAFKYSTVPLTNPTVNDFQGLWKQFVGAKGVKGDDGDRYKSTSLTSLTVDTNTKTLIVSPNLAWTEGQPITIVSGSRKIYGTVLSYIPSTGEMTVEVTFTNGAGSASNWTVNLGSFFTNSLWTKSGDGIYYNSGNVAVGRQVDNTDLIGSTIKPAFQITGSLAIDEGGVVFFDTDSGSFTSGNLLNSIFASSDRLNIISTSEYNDFNVYSKVYDVPFDSTSYISRTSISITRQGSNGYESMGMYNTHTNTTRYADISINNSGSQSKKLPFRFRYNSDTVYDIDPVNSYLFTHKYKVDFEKDLTLLSAANLYIKKLSTASGTKVLTVDSNGLVGVDDLISVPLYDLDDVTTNGNSTTNDISVGTVYATDAVIGDAAVTGITNLFGGLNLYNVVKSDVADYLLGVKQSNGVVKRIIVGDNLNFDGNTLSADSYTLTKATSGELGGVKIGNTMSISGDGTINYTLPTATNGTLGGIKVGSTLSMSSGILNYDLPTMSSSIKGGAKKGDGLKLDGDVLSVDNSYIQNFIIKVDTKKQIFSPNYIAVSSSNITTIKTHTFSMSTSKAKDVSFNVIAVPQNTTYDFIMLVKINGMSAAQLHYERTNASQFHDNAQISGIESNITAPNGNIEVEVLALSAGAALNLSVAIIAIQAIDRE